MKRLNITLLLFAILLVISFGANSQGFNGYYRYPDIHGSTIVFTAEGDLWKVNAQGGVATRLTTHQGEELYPKISPDGKTIAVAAGTPAQMGEVRTFQVSDGKLIRDYQTTGDSVFAVAFSPDGKRLATAGADRSVRVYDVATGEQQLLIERNANWMTHILEIKDQTAVIAVGVGHFSDEHGLLNQLEQAGYSLTRAEF